MIFLVEYQIFVSFLVDDLKRIKFKMIFSSSLVSISIYGWANFHVAANEFAVANVTGTSIQTRIFQWLSAQCVIVTAKLLRQLVVAARSLTSHFGIQIYFVINEALQETSYHLVIVRF